MTPPAPRPLSAVFAAELVPGVHLWSSPLDAAYVGGVVRRAGWRFAHLAGARITGVAAFHAAIAEALTLPAYYGRNLDALAECLDACDGSHLLLWDDWGVFASREPRVAGIALGLLGSSRVTTLLRGEGPARLTPRAG